MGVFLDRQPLNLSEVEDFVRNLKLTLPQLLLMLTIGACATEETLDPPAELGSREIWEELGCADDQVAICIAVHCQPEDWVCADRAALRDLFSPHRNN